MRMEVIKRHQHKELVEYIINPRKGYVATIENLKRRTIPLRKQPSGLETLIHTNPNGYDQVES